MLFPSVDVIERTLAEATTLADRAVFSALTAQPEPGHKAALDRLLASEGEQPSRLAWMLQPPGKINGKNVLQHIDQLNAIESLALPDGIALSVHQNRLLKLARGRRKMSSRGLAKFTDVRRYASLVCIISEARATLTDEIIDVFPAYLGINRIFDFRLSHCVRTFVRPGLKFSGRRLISSFLIYLIHFFLLPPHKAGERLLQ